MYNLVIILILIISPCPSATFIPSQRVGYVTWLLVCHITDLHILRITANRNLLPIYGVPSVDATGLAVDYVMQSSPMTSPDKHKGFSIRCLTCSPTQSPSHMSERHKALGAGTCTWRLTEAEWRSNKQLPYSIAELRCLHLGPTASGSSGLQQLSQSLYQASAVLGVTPRFQPFLWFLLS